MSAHDRWLANYRHTVTDAWCVHTGCENNTSPIAVDYEEEYGQGWIQPEDCPVCGSELTLDCPKEAQA